MNYIERFENLSFGLFVHFGLYSIVGKGEWYLHIYKADKQQYEQLTKEFNINKYWARDLAKTAKETGCKYITVTTRHHDGFSLYDTKGLTDFDAPHSACGRDLIAELVDACRQEGLLLIFYHTLLDWHHKSYTENFPEYIDYLIQSVEILCKNYGPVGGFWFDGMWDKPNADWQEDRLYGTIRRLQPDAMIINNTGLSELGRVGHPQIDSVTFERGKPAFVDQSDKHRAGEMCQVLNDHWGYAKNDCNYKSVKELIGNLIECKQFGCNFLLNTGLMGDGSVRDIDRCILSAIGLWTEKNKEAIYGTRPSKHISDEAILLSNGKYTYAVINDVPMFADPNVAQRCNGRDIKINAPLVCGEWLDDESPIELTSDCSFALKPYPYGYSYSYRVARLHIKEQ